MEAMQVVALVLVTAFAFVAAKRAMDHAAVGYFAVRDGHSATPRADMATVWALSLASITVLVTVMGTFLRALAQLRH